jgi:hypothetical protein
MEGPDTICDAPHAEVCATHGLKLNVPGNVASIASFCSSIMIQQHA